MAKMTPEQEANYALDYKVPKEQISPAAQAVYDEVLRQRYEAAGGAHSTPRPSRPVTQPRFPSDPDTRRQILQAIAGRNEKYARPFDVGAVARYSYIGTESWSEYGAVVLQMAMLDTLMSIEEKLGKLLEQPEPEM